MGATSELARALGLLAVVVGLCALALGSIGTFFWFLAACGKFPYSGWQIINWIAGLERCV